jgi:UBA/TS-N domain
MLPLLLIPVYTPLPPVRTSTGNDQDCDEWRALLLEYRNEQTMADYAGAVWQLLHHDQQSGTMMMAHHPPRLQWQIRNDQPPPHNDDPKNHRELQQVVESTSWRMELDLALWNLAADCLHQSSSITTPTTTPITKLEWNATSKNLQTAASFLHHCSPQNLPDAALYELLFLAEGQRCVYQAFAGQPRPKHFLLAKLCMTVANMYTLLEEEYELSNTNNTDIADAVRAWGMYMTALAEYHQSQVDNGPAAAARLENARKFASFCTDFLDSCAIEIPALTDFITILDGMPQPPSCDDPADGLLFDVDELPEIPAQPAVIKINPQLESMLKIPTTTTTTTNNLGLLHSTTTTTMRPEFQPLVSQFQSSLQSLVLEKSRLAERKTETARTALQSVHLPQSITAYTNAEQTLSSQQQQQQQQPVLPPHNNNDTTTAELQRSAESAWGLVESIDRRIDEDLTGDIQMTFRNALTQYQTVLEKAALSDSALRDRSLPRVPVTTPIIVTELSQSLAQLSTLFHERDTAVRNLRSRVDQQLQHLTTVLRQCDSEEEVRTILATVRQKLEEESITPLERNFEQQSKLLYQIMQENDRFQRDEDLALLEDAVGQHDRFARHLQEGLSFYHTIMPKLQKLAAQVDEVCARLLLSSSDDDNDNDKRSTAIVDDEKVANLVAMDFEFEKVVSALRKHDNNLEQALNDLLSC